jgi:hypothetical protein
MSFLYISALIFNDNSVYYTSINADMSVVSTFYTAELANNFATTRVLTQFTLNIWPTVWSIAYADMTSAQQNGLAVYVTNVANLVTYGVYTVLNTTLTNSNVVLGTGSGTQLSNTVGNVIVGPSAGQQVSTLGPLTAVGYQAGKTATRPNTIVGYNAGTALTSGSSNLCIGNGVASSLVTGSTNALVGEGVAVGYTGSGSVCIGSSTTKCGTASSSNVVVGCGLAGFSLTTGSSNVLVGNGAGSSLTTGGTNIFVGASAGTTIATGSRNICIGANGGSSSESSTIRIGSTQTNCYIAGISRQNVSEATAVYVDSTGQLGTVSSSRRYKKDIEDISPRTVNELNFMKVKSFRYANDSPDSPLQYGMIAEEMHNINPGLVQYDELGQPQTIYYHLLVPMLLKYVQDLRDEIELLKKY